MVVADTSAIIAAANIADRWHTPVRAALLDDSRPLILPAPIVSEVGYMLEANLGERAVAAFMDSIASGSLLLDCCELDAPTVSELLKRYADLRLGVADAYVAVCGRRQGGTVMTTDRRHFDPLARELGLSLIPEHPPLREDTHRDYDAEG